MRVNKLYLLDDVRVNNNQDTNREQRSDII